MIVKKIFLTVLLIIAVTYGCKEKPAQTNRSTFISTEKEEEIVENKIDTAGCFMYRPDDFPDNLTVIRKNEKAGVIDNENNLIVPCIYTSIESMFSDYGLLAVRKIEDRRCGIIEYKTGRTVIPFDYHSFNRVSHTDRYIQAYGDGQKYCIIDLKAEKVVIPPKYWTILGHGGYFFCNDGGGFRLMDSTYNVAMSKVYNDVRGWYDDKASLGFIVKEDDRFGVVMDRGEGLQEVVPCQYDDISDFYSGMYIPVDPIQVLKKDEKYGILSIAGKVLLPCEYDEFSDEFIDGLISISKDDKWGLIEVFKDTLTEVAPCIYDTLKWSFSEEGQVNAVGVIVNERTDTIEYEKYIRF